MNRSTRARPTDDELLDAARTVFVECGFRATTMNAIADRSGSTKPTLYAHFGDKNTLYRRLLDREAAACRARLFAEYERNDGLGLRTQVAADTQALFDYAAAEPDGFRLLFGVDITSDTIAVRELLLADIDEQVTRRIRAYLTARGLPPRDDERRLANILVGVATTSARHAIDHGLDLTSAARLAADFSTAALVNLPAVPSS
ncbi:TetR/AcrR family transcriptional regulator [Amycolatopsis sp. NPDC050768]|uniref:TetR/AcrR family transcriptional regulator n=1 Tax=Amycolatopsis sp. NPDC050768 TaxID=3154839 RepID=UPI0033C616A3